MGNGRTDGTHQTAERFNRNIHTLKNISRVRTLEEILALPNIGQKIAYLKKGRKTELPDRCKLWDDWNPQRHEIMVDKEKYPDRKVLEKEAEKVYDDKTGEDGEGYPTYPVFTSNYFYTK